jgi:uncharacterized protein (DUF697 family)
MPNLAKAASPIPHRDLAVLGAMQARTRITTAQRIYGARVATDGHARLAMHLIDILEPMLVAIEGLLHEPVTERTESGTIAKAT